MSLSRRSLLALGVSVFFTRGAYSFSREELLNYAREVSKAPFAPISTARNLTQLSLEQYQEIAFKEPLFSSEKYSLSPLHQGNIFQTPTRIYTIEAGKAVEQVYAASQFNLSTHPATERGSYSGFSVREKLAEVLRFQAGTTFAALASSQVMGVLSRGLALNVAESAGEEFPAFRTFWIERPQDSLIIHALLESESVTGLYRFNFKHGDSSTMEVEVTLFPRVDLTHVGLAPCVGSFLFAPNDRVNVDDVRGQVHDVQGLALLTGTGEQVWRPLHNPEILQLSSFMDNNPKGFGLIQRERLFDSFQDLDNKFQRKPSLWVEPLQEWGEGQVSLVEIPSESVTNKNIIAYWRPKIALAAKSEFRYSYRLHWFWEVPFAQQGAMVTQTRQGRTASKRRRFIVDFNGKEVDTAEKAAQITANLTHVRGKIHALSTRFSPEIEGLRVMFELDPEGSANCELRLTLERDKKPISETFLYRWTPN